MYDPEILYTVLQLAIPALWITLYVTVLRNGSPRRS